MSSEIASQSFKGRRMLERAKYLNASPAYQDKSRQTNDKHSLRLFGNVQFIYELALVQLELHSLGANYEITDGLRKFKLSLRNITRLESGDTTLGWFV